MELHVDNRECTVDYFRGKAYPWVHFGNLDLGDYVFKVKGTVVCIIERKTVEDLANSIRDGRYREQKARLFSQYDSRQIMYLVEGDVTVPNGSIQYNKVSRSTIYSSLLNLLLRDGLHLFMTQTTQDTILFLEEFAQKLHKQGTRFLASSEGARSTETCLFQSMKTSSKKKMTPDLVYRVQLSAIPGVSLKTASTIMESYPTLQSLMEGLGALPPEERFNTICNLRSASQPLESHGDWGKSCTQCDAFLFPNAPSSPSSSDGVHCAD